MSTSHFRPLLFPHFLASHAHGQFALHALEVPPAGLWKLAGIDGAFQWCRWPIFFFRQFFLHVNTPSVYQCFTKRLKPLPNLAMADGGKSLRFQLDEPYFGFRITNDQRFTPRLSDEKCKATSSSH